MGAEVSSEPPLGLLNQVEVQVTKASREVCVYGGGRAVYRPRDGQVKLIVGGQVTR